MSRYFFVENVSAGIGALLLVALGFVYCHQPAQVPPTTVDSVCQSLEAQLRARVADTNAAMQAKFGADAEAKIERVVCLGNRVVAKTLLSGTVEGQLTEMCMYVVLVQDDAGQVSAGIVECETQPEETWKLTPIGTL